jgi:hypothetical protein
MNQQVLVNFRLITSIMIHELNRFPKLNYEKKNCSIITDYIKLNRLVRTQSISFGITIRLDMTACSKCFLPQSYLTKISEHNFTN